MAAGLADSGPPDVVPRSQDALRLTELARDLGLHEPVHDRLMDALWREGLDLGERDVLRRLGTEAGLPAARLDEVLAGEDYLDRVTASTREAVWIGVTGIPGFLLDGRLLVLGAQPREVFEQAFSQLEASGPGSGRGPGGRADQEP